MIVLNFLLALAWLVLTGEFTTLNFLIGFVAATGLIWLVQRLSPDRPEPSQRPAYGLKTIQWISFGLYFVWALILANLRVAIDVLRPRPQITPAVVTVPLVDYTDAEVTLLANFITLTPGTLSLDVIDDSVSEDGDTKRMLYVHAMHAGRTQDAIEDFRRQLSGSLGRRVKEVMNG